MESGTLAPQIELQIADRAEAARERLQEYIDNPGRIADREGALTLTRRTAPSRLA